MSDDADKLPRIPSELPLEPYRLSSKAMEEAYRSVARRPTDPEGHTRPAPALVQEAPPLSQRLPGTEKRTSALITSLFAVSILGTATFAVAYILMGGHRPQLGLEQNLALGTGLGLSMLGLGAGMIVMGKKLAPAVESVQERSPHESPEEDEKAAEEELIGGMTEAGITQRRLMRRTMLAALGVLPLPFIVGLRDMGPKPGYQLRANAWQAHDRLIDIDTGEPVKFGDLDAGGIVTVMPESHPDPHDPINAESPVNLMRLPAGYNHPLPGRAGWAAQDHVAYSRICTHAGCPVSLFQKEDMFLVCPCHQSTFNVPYGCTVVFGPAARPLPQLPIYLDDQGYFRCLHPFDVPLGPSFWGRTRTTKA